MRYLISLGLLAFACVSGWSEIGEIDVHSGPPVVSEAPATDGSVLWVLSKTRITVMMLDSKGRRTGYDFKTDKTLTEIPNSECSVDFVPNQYTGDPHSEAYQRFTIQPATSGAYTIQVRGLQDGPFQIDISAQSTNGSSEPSKQIEGLISAKEMKTFRLNYDASPSMQMTVIEQTPRH